MKGRWLGLLLRLYPRRLRAAYSDDLERFLSAQRAERRYAGRFGSLLFALRVAEDALRARVVPGRPLGSDSEAPLPSRRHSFAGFLDDVRRELAYAMRTLARTPAFTVAAVLTLALGVGANGAVFSLLDRLFGQPPAGVRAPEELRRLYAWLPVRPNRSVPMTVPEFNLANFRSVHDAVSVHAEVVGWTLSRDGVIKAGARQLNARVSLVTPDFFSVLGVDAALGRLFDAGSESGAEPPLAVLSHALWKRDFAEDASIIGRSIALDSVTYTVVGVAAEAFSGLDHSRVDVFLPLGMLVDDERSPPRVHMVARLPPGSNDATLEILGTLGYRAWERTRDRRLSDRTSAVVVGPIIAANGPGRWEWSQAAAVSRRVGGVAVIVLLIACANVVCLLLVRAHRRGHEIALRVALGVSRRRLFSQLVVESLVLASLAGSAALLIASWGGSVLRRVLLPDIAWAESGLEPRVVLLVLATALAAGLVAGLLTFSQSGGTELGSALKIRARGRAGFALRSGLLVAQASLSLILLAGAGLFLRSLGNVTKLIEYDAEHVGSIWAQSALVSAGKVEPEALSALAERVAREPGVRGVALTAHAPIAGGYSGGRAFMPDGDSLPEFNQASRYYVVSPNFFEVSGLRMVAGRTFAAGETEAVVVNETVARSFWPGEDPLSKCLRINYVDSPCWQVIGVAADAPWSRRVISTPSLQFFTTFRGQYGPRGIIVRVDRAGWASVAALAKSELEARYGPGSFQMAHLSETLDPELRPWRLGAHLFAAFGALALVVTFVGIYSVMAYVVSLRTHEMGVRIALGATMGDVLRAVLGDGLRVVVLGLLIGVSITFALGKAIQPMLYGVSPRDPLVLAGAACALLLAGIAANFAPAWRAGRVDPVKVLAAE